MGVVKGSFVAVQIGLLVAALCAGVMFGGAYFVIVAFYVYVYMLMFALPVWLLVFLPMYAWIPLDSPIWHPFLCSLVGITFGAGIMKGLTLALPALGSMGNLAVALAAVVGGVSCYTAARTVHKYRTVPQNR